MTEDDTLTPEDIQFLALWPDRSDDVRLFQHYADLSPQCKRVVRILIRDWRSDGHTDWQIRQILLGHGVILPHP
jgi:hypothetical protein